MSSKTNQYTDYINNVSGKVLLGCDGYVDETFEIVSERRSLSDFTAMKKLRNFAELLTERADGGVGLEIVPKRRCEGGFGINTARITAFLGIDSVVPGLFGRSEIDPAFTEFENVIDLHSLGDPALTIALEFGDGKVLMSNIEAVSSLTWGDFDSHFDPSQKKDLFSGVDILGLGYWSLTADFDAFFEGFMKQYENGKAPRRMFFDFADIKKKSKESFEKSLNLIRKYDEKIPMTLSVNEHEVLEVFLRVGVDCQTLEADTFIPALKEAREKIGLNELLVHTPNFAAASNATDGEGFALQERQTEVVRTAGAGDSFNGGYISASLGDLPIKERLVIANAATAFFVTHATGPSKEQLIEQIDAAADK